VTALILDQLNRLDPALARGLAPESPEMLSLDAAYRNALLESLKKIRQWSQAARGAQGDAIADALRWQVAYLHSRAVPFWIARDVDGLATICGATGIEPPFGLGSAAGLFVGVSAEFPELCEGLRVEMHGPRELGGYAGPEDVPELLRFLSEHGGRMIQAAARHGEGPLCTQVLRKIRECLRFAERHGVGYLEVGGIHPPLEDPAETAGALDAIPVLGG
jgi:hypothetical protein